MFQVSRNLFKLRFTFAVAEYAMLCAETFVFPGSFGKWSDTIVVKCTLESMNTSGCKFQNYVASLLTSSRGRKPYCFGVISKSSTLLGNDQTEESELVWDPKQKSPEIVTFASGWKRHMHISQALSLIFVKLQTPWKSFHIPCITLPTKQPWEKLKTHFHPSFL